MTRTLEKALSAEKGSARNRQSLPVYMGRRRP